MDDQATIPPVHALARPSSFEWLLLLAASAACVLWIVVPAMGFGGGAHADDVSAAGNRLGIRQVPYASLIARGDDAFVLAVVHDSTLPGRVRADALAELERRQGTAFALDLALSTLEASAATTAASTGAVVDAALPGRRVPQPIVRFVIERPDGAFAARAVALLATDATQQVAWRVEFATAWSGVLEAWARAELAARSPLGAGWDDDLAAVAVALEVLDEHDALAAFEYAANCIDRLEFPLSRIDRLGFVSRALDGIGAAEDGPLALTVQTWLIEAFFPRVVPTFDVAPSEPGPTGAWRLCVEHALDAVADSATTMTNASDDGGAGAPSAEDVTSQLWRTLIALEGSLNVSVDAQWAERVAITREQITALLNRGR